MNFLDIVKSELKFQKHLLRQFNALRRIKDDGQLFCKRTRNGYTNFYIKEKTGGGRTMSSIVTFYCGDPKNAPKTTMPAHLGANAILTWNGRLLMERRRDADVWGLVGGGAKKWETGRQAIAREVYEELGLRIRPEAFEKLKVYDDPGRIAAYRDGSVWRMVIVLYGFAFDREPVLRISRESKELRFFTKEEAQNIEIAVTHQDLVREWFLERG